MSKLNKISIVSAARTLGYELTGKLSGELLVLSCLNYLNKHYSELTKVELDSAFINPDGSINNFAYSATQVRHTEQREVRNIKNQLEKDNE